eukprot:PhF_6_TR40640/c4_g1_i2/m.61012
MNGTQSQDYNKIFDMIRRLEPIEDAMGLNWKLIDKRGESALHWAAKYGHDGCMHVLLKFDPTMTKMLENDGTSALHWAERGRAMRLRRGEQCIAHDDCIRTLLIIDPTMTT